MKTLFTTKTFWAGIGSLIAGAGLIFTGDKTNGFILISQGIGQIFLRSALLKKDNQSNN